MKYEFRAPTLSQVVRKSISGRSLQLQKKTSATIDSGIGGSWNNGSIYVDVELGRTYEISWEAEDAVADGSALYNIRIHSVDGHGSHEETFTHSGSWSFEAQMTDTIEFAIEVSFSAGSIFGSYPVNISIN